MKKKFGVRQKVENPQLVADFFAELCADVPKNSDDLEKRKRNFSARKKCSTILNRDLIAVMNAYENNPLSPPLSGGRKRKKNPAKIRKPIKKTRRRTISGVTPIGILTKPYGCPGRWVYLPRPKMAYAQKTYLGINKPCLAGSRRKRK